MNEIEEPDHPSIGVALSRSIGSDGIELITSSADILIDKMISSGALDGVPIVGLISSGFKSTRAVRDHLYLIKLRKFLQALEDTSKAERDEFVSELQKKGKMEHFGETILLILDTIDDASKPAIVGRILAAHISGKIASFDKAMRLIAIVNRVYAADIAYLGSFQPGLPKDSDVAASLYAVGLLANTGYDGGGIDQDLKPGGFTYDLNDYGKLLIAYGIK